MRKYIVATLLMVSNLLSLWAASAANCEEHAESIEFKDTVRTVRLVPSYDPESGTTDSERGVYYFKSKLIRSGAYTVWTEGLSTNDEVSVFAFAADPKDDDDEGPSADFGEVEEPAGNTRLIMYADDWYFDDEDKEENDPKKWVYYFEIEGPVGKEVTIHFQYGARIPSGREDNPLMITPSDKGIREEKHKLELNSQFFFRVNFKAGQLYWFATKGGTATSLMDVDLDIEDKDVDAENEQEDDREFTIFPDPAYDEDKMNTGIYAVANVSGYYNVVVSAEGEDADEANFSLLYRTYATKAITAHPSVELNEGNGFSCEITAGYKSTRANLEAGIYDEIIDESLCRFSAVKGNRYLVETVDAKTNLLMRVYDSKGTVLYENKGDGRTLNSRIAFSPTADGVYYIGVCQLLQDEFAEEPDYTKAKIRITDASTVDGQPDEWDPQDDTYVTAVPLSPVPSTEETDRPEELDSEGHGYHELGPTDWADVFMIGGRKDIVYSFRTTLEKPEEVYNALKAEVFTISGGKERVVETVGNINWDSDVPLSFIAAANTAYYLRVQVAGGQGLDYPKYKVHAIGRSYYGTPLGVLTVNIHGVTTGTWSLDRESVKYTDGASVLVSGIHSIKYGSVKGFSAPATESVTIVAGKSATVLERYYSDTSDPKDDSAKGATAWGLKNVETVMERTFWMNDPEDNFVFAGKDGQYYDFELRDVTGDAVFSITNAEIGIVAADVKRVSQILLPTTKAKYYLTVKHSESTPVDGSYVIAGFFANVGSIKFAKTQLSAKEDAAFVPVVINRTAKDGAVRVKYGTVAGSAKPGVDYVAQNGVLEWAAGDNKAKTVQIKLIPDLVPVYEGDKTFSVKLEAIPEEERTTAEYPCAVTGGDLCTIVLKETAKEGVTIADAYAKQAVKMATTKTEDVALSTGTFYGVLTESVPVLTNGLPRLASVTLTVSTSDPAKLSAKVLLAGKTYSFAAVGWNEEMSNEENLVQTLTQVQKIAGSVYTNELTVSVARGMTSAEADWLKAGGSVALLMNVPDANGKGVQEEIGYEGAIFRNNAKIQNYLTAVTNFAGYYTVSLLPDSAVSDGVPAGNGYLTMTIDNKGQAKIAGMLSDGVTKPSMSVAACAICEDSASVNGYSMYIPVYQVKAPSCFGGILRLYAQPEDGKVVVDALGTLMWNNDNKAATYDNEEGYQIELQPAGGWYDKVVNLQSYYLNRAFQVGTVEVSEFPAEIISEGFELVADIGPNEEPVDLSGNVFSTSKQELMKVGKLYDFAKSINPSGTQIKFARATGLVSGTFSPWAVNASGSSQQQVKGIKFFGVAVLARESYSPLDDEVVAAGFFTQAVTVVDENPETGKKSNRKWTFSAPFHLLGIDRGNVDWWSDDWGESLP